MNARKTRLLLRCTAVVLLLSSAVVVAWAFQSPHSRQVGDDDLAAARRSTSRRTRLISSPPLQDFARVWQKELRRPLYDPPPEPKAEKRKEKKDPAKKRRRENNRAEGGVQLVGTMLEGDRSLAVFMDSRGKIDLKGVGQTLELAPETRVERIELTQVTISHPAGSTTLELPSTEAR